MIEQRANLWLALLGAAALAGARAAAGWIDGDLWGLATTSADTGIAAGLGLALAARAEARWAAPLALGLLAAAALAWGLGLPLASPATAAPLVPAATLWRDRGAAARLGGSAAALAAAAALLWLGGGAPAPAAASRVAAAATGLDLASVIRADPRPGDPMERTAATAEAVAARVAHLEGRRRAAYTARLGTPRAVIRAARLVTTLAEGLRQARVGSPFRRITCVTAALGSGELVCAVGPRYRRRRELAALARAGARTDLLADAYPLGAIDAPHRNPSHTDAALAAFSALQLGAAEWTPVDVGEAAVPATRSRPFLARPPRRARWAAAARLLFLAAMLAALGVWPGRQRPLAGAAAAVAGAGFGLAAFGWIGLSGAPFWASAAWLAGAAAGAGLATRGAARGAALAAGLGLSLVAVAALFGPAPWALLGLGALAGVALATPRSPALAAAGIAAIAAGPLMAAAVGLGWTAALGTGLLMIGAVAGGAAARARIG